MFAGGILEPLPPHLTAQIISICELPKLFRTCEIQLLVMFIDAPEGYDRFWIRHYLAALTYRGYCRICSPVETHAGRLCQRYIHHATSLALHLKRVALIAQLVERDVSHLTTSCSIDQALTPIQTSIQILQCRGLQFDSE